MRHLVVFSHPSPESFNAQVCRAYVQELQARDHDVVLRDLYAMRFDPVLRREDIDAARRDEAAEDIRVEQAHVRWAEVITFVSPIWWISWPAMLKGYVDRVFALNFAYRYGKDGVEGCLGGKRALIITTSGSTMEDFIETGKLRSITTAQDFGTMEFCAIEMIEHRHFAPVGRRTLPARFPEMLEEVRAMVRKHF